MPLSKEEWDQVANAICDVVNGVSSERDLLRQVKRLRLKHGPLPILLSTEADFIDSVEDRLRLYKKAVELSQDPPDASCLTQSAESLAEIYIQELADYENGLIWVEKMKKYISLYGGEYILSSSSEIEAKLNRLKIQCV